MAEELRSILDDKLQELEEERKRPATEEEILELLRESGHPLLVASRYGGNRALVSAALLPLYKQVLKYMLLGFFALLILSGVMSALELDAWPAGVGGSIETVGLWCIVLVTVAFHFADPLLERLDWFGRWSPRRLPPADAKPIPIFDSVVAAIASLFVFSILSGIDNRLDAEALLGLAGPASLILWLKIRLLLGMAAHVTALFRPYWSRPRVLYTMAIDALLAAIGVRALMLAGDLHPIGLAFLGLLVVVGLFGVAGGLYRLRGRRSPLQRQVERQLEQSLPKGFGASVGERVRADLKKHRDESD